MKRADLIKLIPARVRITRDVTYEILFIDSFTDPKQVGECRFHEKQIVIKKGESPTETYKTYLHEKFHAYSFEFPELNLTEKQVKLLEEAEYKYQKFNKILDVLSKNS
jgi:hypothetical protein